MPRALLSLILLCTCLLGGLGCTRAAHLVAQVQSVSPRALPQDAMLLDVRSPGEYRADHIPGALSLPAEGLAGYLSRCPVSQDQTLFLVCEHGRRSQLAGAEAAYWHRGPIRDIAGGMEAWRNAGLPLAPGNGDTPPLALLATPVKVLSPFEQGIAFTSGFIIKPIYMLLCLGLIAVLWRSMGSLAMLRWGLICFLVGESFCALDYLFGQAGVLRPLDLVHGLGMAAMGALAPWALFRLVDQRVFHYVDPSQACSFQRLCGACWKRQPVGCGLHRLFIFTLPALILITLMPLCAPLKATAYQVGILGHPSLLDVSLFNEAIELWGYALLAILAFLVTLVRLRGGSESTRRAELPFFLGLGFATFAVFRFLLHNAFVEAQHWSGAWEEITELIIIVGLGFGLFVFRGPLGLSRKPSHA